jgi:hypothetical protein
LRADAAIAFLPRGSMAPQPLRRALSPR